MRTKARSFFEFKRAKAGLALQLAIYLCAIGTFVLVAFARARLHSGFLILLASLVFCFSIVALFWMSHVSRRLRGRIITNLPAFREYIDQSNRLLILYLREFASDGAATSFKSYWTDEENIVGQVRRYGVLLAVGKPGERLPPGGGYRLYLHKEDWKSEVLDLIVRADVIVCRCGQTEALRWELRQIVEKRKLERTVFVSSGAEGNFAVYQDIHQLASISLPGNDAQSSCLSSLAKLREVAPEGTEFFSRENLNNLERTIHLLPLYELCKAASVFVVTNGVVKPLSGPLNSSLLEAFEIIGLKQSSRGVIDKENPWEFENLISVLGLLGIGFVFLLLIMAFVLRPLFNYVGFGEGVNFIEANFVYFLFVSCALFLLIFILRP